MPKFALIMMMSVFVGVVVQVRAESPAPEQAGEIAAVIGEVATVAVSSAEGSRQAAKGDPLYVSDVITTTDFQTARIVLKDLSELVLAPGGSLRISEFVARSGANRTILSLLFGKLRTLVRRAYLGTDLFEVATPGAVMGVRGTHFIVDYDRGTGETALHVLHGLVAFGPSGGAGRISLVGAGFRSVFRPGMKAPRPPEKFDPGKYRLDLKTTAPDFERQVGEDRADTASSPATSPKSLADALHEHDVKEGGGLPPPSVGGPPTGEPRNLRGGQPGMGPGPGQGSPGQGPSPFLPRPGLTAGSTPGGTNTPPPPQFPPPIAGNPGKPGPGGTPNTPPPNTSHR